MIRIVELILGSSWAQDQDLGTTTTLRMLSVYSVEGSKTEVWGPFQCEGKKKVVFPARYNSSVANTASGPRGGKEVRTAFPVLHS